MIIKPKNNPQARRNKSEDEVASTSRHPIIYIVGVVGFLMFAYGGYLTQKMLDPAAFPIRKIAVEGEFHHLDAEHLEQVVSSAIHDGFFGVDVADVRQRLLDEPWIFDASVRRVWPDSIRVSITEQQAVARWGEYALLNRFADIFVPEVDSMPRGLVRLDGPLGSEVELLSRYQLIQQRLGEIDLRVAGVRLSERRAWVVEIENGATLMIGRQAIAARLGRFNHAFKQVLKENWSRVALVDLRYTNGFAIREKLLAQENG